MMHCGGTTKLSEECGELIQVLMKAQALGTLGVHWDGSDLRKRLQEELADVFAAANFVVDKFQLDKKAMLDRQRAKVALFCEWDEQ